MTRHTYTITQRDYGQVEMKGWRLNRSFAVRQVDHGDDGETRWVVDHLPTGMGLGPDWLFNTKALAVKFARQFDYVAMDVQDPLEAAAAIRDTWDRVTSGYVPRWFGG